MPRSGKLKTSQGTLRVLVLFINYTNDNIDTDYWGEDNPAPIWGNSVINTTVPQNNNFTALSISDFFDRSSGGNGSGTLGDFTVIGDIYSVNIAEPANDGTAITRLSRP